MTFETRKIEMMQMVEMTKRNSSGSGVCTVETKEPLILMVEDELILLELFKYKFRHLPYRFESRDNGWDGLKAIYELKPDLVILDLMIPGLPGKSLLKELRSNNEIDQPKVLVVSSKNSERDVDDIYSLGADDYVGKPFLLNEMLARIERLLK